MKARCGLEDCDCEYTIEQLVAVLKGARDELWGLAERRAKGSSVDLALFSSVPMRVGMIEATLTLVEGRRPW